MKARADTTQMSINTKLPVVGCSTMAILVCVAVSACTGFTPSAAPTSLSGAGPTSSAPAVSAGSAASGSVSTSASNSASQPVSPAATQDAPTSSLQSLSASAPPPPVPGTEPPTATAAQPTANSNCGGPVFIGLHGMAEGPSDTIPAVSPEITSFDTDQNAISGAVLNAPVTYPTVYPDFWSVLLKTYYAITTGEGYLDADVKSYAAGCSASQDKIALVGYSMGAWIINKWIMDHPLERFMIKAVVLLGDPCWVNGNDQGLVRRWAGGYGCMPAADYPYPIPGDTTANPFPVRSSTLANDPVSGDGWGGNTRDAQLGAAENCTNGTTCSHLNYTGGTEIYQGAEFVVSQLIR